MKRIYSSGIIAITFLFSSCGTYRYYQPTANPVLFSGPAEVHISGEVGTSGWSSKGGFSINEYLAVMGQYNAGFTEYRSSEGELGLGYYTAAKPNGIFIGGGLGFGNNYGYTDSTYSVKSFEGNFYKPFAQFNYGVTGGKIIGGLRGDVIMMLKSSYLIYDGKKLNGSDEKLSSNYTLIEPSFAVGLGSNVFRFELIYGFPIHFRWIESPKPAVRTFPMNLSVGFHLVFGRKKNL